MCSCAVVQCPQSAIRALVTEAKRLLGPSGVLAIIDNNPRCAHGSTCFQFRGEGGMRSGDKLE